jgi:hypothetical protein
MSTEDYTEGEYTEAELAGLSDEEREAVSSDDESAAADTGTDEVDGDDTDGGEIVPLQDDHVQEQEKAPVVHHDTVPLPSDIAEQFKAERAELARQFDEGEIELADLLDRRDDVARMERDAEEKHNVDVRAANDWQAAQDKFFSDNGHYLTDKDRHIALDACVKAVANMPGVLSFDDCLGKAKRMEEAMNGHVAVSKPPPPAEKGKSPRPEAPSIVDLPASAANESAGEFDYIDKLTGVELEDALSKLSEAKQERYLSGK